MTADKILDYDQLVASYSTNLDVTLRGFRPAEEMLDTWVPDDNTVRSLYSLVEAAQLCGSNSVSVRVSNKTLGADAAALKEKLASLGEVTTKTDGDAVTFEISKLQETAGFRSVRPIYQHKLQERFSNLKFKRPLKAQDKNIALRVEEENFSLSIAVQPDDHVIADAVFDSQISGPMLAVLDYLCEILIGLPIQEARDHSIVRLEFSLRAPGQHHPVSGIVLPQNADAIFRLPSILIDRLFENYKISTNYKPGMNFFDPGPGKTWMSLTPEERQERASAAINAHVASLGLKEGDVEVIDCKQSYAVTVRFGDDLRIPAKRKAALALERLIRQKCDPRIEIFCEEKKDLSKLRRLTPEKANP